MSRLGFESDKSFEEVGKKTGLKCSRPEVLFASSQQRFHPLIWTIPLHSDAYQKYISCTFGQKKALCNLQVCDLRLARKTLLAPMKVKKRIWKIKGRAMAKSLILLTKAHGFHWHCEFCTKKYRNALLLTVRGLRLWNLLFAIYCLILH